jgi:hypothetical protein
LRFSIPDQCSVRARLAHGAAAGLLFTAGSFVAFGAGLGGAAPRLTPVAGIFQRISIAAGFGWLSALSLALPPGARER